MFCEKCGNVIEEGAAFCPKCGNQVESDAKSTGSAPLFGSTSDLQQPSLDWQTVQGRQGSSKQKPNISRNAIAAIGGGAAALVAAIVLIVMLVNIGGNGKSNQRDKDRTTASENNELSDDLDKAAIAENKELLLGEWVSRKETTIGSEYAEIYLNAFLEALRKDGSNQADLMEELIEDYYSELSSDELLEEIRLDEPTRIGLEFTEDSRFLVKMYDEWGDYAATYKVLDNNTVKWMYQYEVTLSNGETHEIAFSYEAEFEVDEDRLTLDFWGKNITFDRT